MPKNANPAHFLLKILNPEGLLIDQMQKEEGIIKIDLDEETMKEYKKRLQMLIYCHHLSPDYAKLIPSKSYTVSLKEKLAKKAAALPSNFFYQFRIIV